MKEQVKALYSSNEEGFKKSGEFKKKRDEIKERLKVINEKFDKQRTEKKVNDENINQQREIIANIDKEIQVLKEKKKEIEKEWDAKWYAYEDQQHLINYIERAQKRRTVIILLIKVSSQTRTKKERTRRIRKATKCSKGN